MKTRGAAQQQHQLVQQRLLRLCLILPLSLAASSSEATAAAAAATAGGNATADFLALPPSERTPQAGAAFCWQRERRPCACVASSPLLACAASERQRDAGLCAAPDSTGWHCQAAPTPALPQPPQPPQPPPPQDEPPAEPKAIHSYYFVIVPLSVALLLLLFCVNRRRRIAQCFRGFDGAGAGGGSGVGGFAGGVSGDHRHLHFDGAGAAPSPQAAYRPVATADPVNLTARH